MRNRLIIAAAALVVAAPALAEDWDFILTNDAGKEIKLVELSPTGSGEWQKQRLDEDRKSEPFVSGKRRSIYFDKANGQCKFDIRATFADDSTGVWPAVDVCDSPYVTIRYRNGTPVAAAS